VGGFLESLIKLGQIPYMDAKVTILGSISRLAGPNVAEVLN